MMNETYWYAHNANGVWQGQDVGPGGDANFCLDFTKNFTKDPAITSMVNRPEYKGGCYDDDGEKLVWMRKKGLVDNQTTRLDIKAKIQ